MPKKRILFVDDEENILHGIRLMLRSIRKDWDISLATGGEAALDMMEKESEFDLVVSDMRMPGMHGTEFLQIVKERYPHTIRFGLSGEADSATMIRAAAITHQFLQKPCDAQNLHNLLARALVMRDQFTNERVRKILMDLNSLPALSAVCQEVIEELNCDEPSLARVGQIVQKDPAIASKLLQVVNSAFMGLRHEVSDIVHAVSLLGLRAVRDVVLMVGIFKLGEDVELPDGVSIDALWQHSLRVGEFAKRIASCESEDSYLASDAFTAGLLHEIGLFILAFRVPNEFLKSVERANEKSIPLQDAEREVLGITHSEVGGFLLELWGLSDPVVEAITFHAYPSGSPDAAFPPEVAALMKEEVPIKFTALTAVHIANYLCEDDEGLSEDEQTGIDTYYLERLGMSDRVGAWFDVCHADG